MKIETREFERHKQVIKMALHRAANARYYSNLFNSNGIIIDKINSYEDFKKIQITDKGIYRKNWFDFFDEKIANELNKNELEEMNLLEKDRYLRKYNIHIICTSGSTGKPLEVYRHAADSHRDYFYLNRYRNLIKPGIFKKKYVWLWPINPVTEKIVFGCNRGFRKMHENGYQFFVYEFSDKVFNKLYEFILLNKIEWIIGSPSALSYFSDFLIKKKKDRKVTISYVECNSEYLFDWQRERIKKAFEVDPISIYAANETLFMAMTCPCRNMHVIGKSAFIELIESERGAREVIVTKLCNELIPLIRYRLGDRAEWSNEQCDCPFGKDPTIKLNCYRLNDFIISRDGIPVEPHVVTDVLFLIQDRGILSVDQYQIIQREYDHFVFNFRIEKKTTRTKQKETCALLEGYFSNLLKYPVRIGINIVKDPIPNDLKSGKFKYFISEVPINKSF